MYRCTDCDKIFENYDILCEKHALENPPYEKIAICPFCRGTNIVALTVKHCRCCGRRLSKSGQEYCNEKCRIKGLKLWNLEQQRRRRLLSNPINILVRELEQYNLLHKTDYTYGTYVGIIRPKLFKKGAQCL